MMSGMRKPPPISTNWERATTTRFRRPSADKRQKHGGRIVVDNHGGFHAGQATQRILGLQKSLATLPGLQIEFQIRIGLRNGTHRVHRGL